MCRNRAMKNGMPTRQYGYFAKYCKQEALKLESSKANFV